MSNLSIRYDWIANGMEQQNLDNHLNKHTSEHVFCCHSKENLLEIRTLKMHILSYVQTFGDFPRL